MIYQRRNAPFFVPNVDTTVIYLNGPQILRAAILTIDVHLLILLDILSCVWKVVKKFVRSRLSQFLALVVNPRLFCI